MPFVLSNLLYLACIYCVAQFGHVGAYLKACHPPTMITPEIVDHILSFLHSDHTTLETCSTVFSQLVDRHLYSHITLRSPAGEDDTDEDAYYPVDPIKFLGLFAKSCFVY